MMSHADLVRRAEKWLKSQGCGVVFRDEFKPIVGSGERPDAIGWRDGLSILVECKTSRADFLSDKKKAFRVIPGNGMGDWRFFLCPPDVIKPEDLPAGWGLLYAMEKIIKKVHGVPSNCNWWNEKPFDGNKRYETQMLYSAVRRTIIHGHFKCIYESVPRTRGDEPLPQKSE